MPLSTNAPFNEFGQSQILRDIEQLYLALNTAGSGGAGDGQTQDQSAATSQEPDLTGLATIDYVDGADNDIYEYIDAAVAGISPDPPVGGDLSGVASNATVTRLRGVNISTTLPSVDEQVLMYNLPLTKWEPITLLTNDGGLVSRSAGGLVEVAGGTALSVVGNATNTTGSINAIAAASANTLLGRRGTTLTWAKVAKAEMADAVGVSVIGRSANSTGVVADITAGADDTVLTRLSGTLSFSGVSRAAMASGTACTVIGRSANSTGAVADIAGVANQVLACNGTPALAFSRTITLGDTTNAGSLTIGNTTSASAVVISPTLVNAVGKILSIREIDVCDAGVAKKMLVLASAPY